MLFLALTMIFTLALAAPALAGDKAELVVNGDPYKQAGVLMQDGLAMIPLQTWAGLAGADVVANADGSLRVIENDAILTITPGQTNAYFNGVPVTITAPATVGDQVCVPLRYIAQTFGFEVGWDSDSGAISLVRNETKDGLTAGELLAKANQAAMEANTYKMDGQLQMNIGMQVDGQTMDELPDNMAINIEFTGQLQNDPMQAYIVQKITPAAGMEIPDLDMDMTMEMYMTEQNMYMKAGDTGWMVQEMPFGSDFWQEQRAMQSDPLKALDQMKEWGILLNFGNDVVFNDQQYYTINATMDTDKFMVAMQDMMQQIMPNMAGVMDPGDVEQSQQMIEKILTQSKIDFSYTAYVNKETILADRMKMDMGLDLAMRPGDFMDSAELEELEGAGELEGSFDLSSEIRLLLDMQGDFFISELNSPFIAPDVSGAQNIMEMMNTTMPTMPETMDRVQ